MSHKKETSTLLSQEDNNQIQLILEHYRQIAEKLHTCTNQEQAEVTLTEINTLSETTQIALLKALSKENITDAADVLVAINAFSPHKEVRKEARRSLIRLEATKIHPQWTPPRANTSAIQVNVVKPPRFWKGFVTQIREEGDIQLFLFWEQGYDYTEARSFIFQLDYWHEGVKDCIVETNSKRHINERIEEIHSQLGTTPITDCTLAEGKRLIEEALSVNQWRGTTPHKDYRNYLPTINSLIMECTDSGEDRGRIFIDPELDEQAVVINFLGAWSLGDYGLVYDFLTNNSSAREGLTRDEWIKLRRAWADEAHPARIELGFVHERERSQSALWLPSSSIGNLSTLRKEIEIGWSLELVDTPLNGTLKEMPMGTAINKETGRHWFWTSYTLVQEQGEWRIQQITDEGANIQGVSIVELQKRVKEFEEAIDATLQQPNDDIQAAVEELSWRLTQLLHYYDALIVRLPLDRQICEDAYARASAIGNPERILVYLQRLAQRFPENHSVILKSLGATFTNLAYRSQEQGLQDRAQRFLSQAEAVLREDIDTNDSAISRILLGELLITQNRLDDAEVELLKAKTMNPGPAEETTLEAGLGNIALQREHMEEALLHYQKVADLDPDYTGIWFNIGFVHRLLEHFTEAEEYYYRAIQKESSDIRPYSELTAISMNRGDQSKARDIAEQGVRARPDSAHMHALLASVLLETGDQQRAKQEIEEAEAINPEEEIVKRVRQYMNVQKKK